MWSSWFEWSRQLQDVHDCGLQDADRKIGEWRILSRSMSFCYDCYSGCRERVEATSANKQAGGRL